MVSIKGRRDYRMAPKWTISRRSWRHFNSRTDVREMVDDDNDDKWPLVINIYIYIVGCRGASQLGGSLLGIPPGYKANKL